MSDNAQIHDTDVPTTDASLPQEGRRPQHRRRRLLTATILTLIAILVLGAGAVSGLYLYYSAKIDRQITRLDNPFADLPEENRPTKTAQAATNILVLGSDSRSADVDTDEWKSQGQRSDVMLLVQFSGDRRHLNVMSFPRDSWVEIPDHGEGKINWAYSYGGAPLAISTVENLTGIHIDHVALVDFASFTTITDALGGVTITTRTEGRQHYNGEEALAFVRERYDLPNGDFDRGRRHLAWMQAIIAQAKSNGSLSGIRHINALIDAVTASLTVDEEFSLSEMRSLALSLRDIPDGNMTFVSMPNLGTTTVGDQSVVSVDHELLEQLSQAWRTDQAHDFITDHHDELTTLSNAPLN